MSYRLLYTVHIYCLQAGWKESAGTFTAELKNLKAGGLTTMGPSIKNAFDLLNLFRMQSGVDTYGQVCTALVKHWVDMVD